MDNLIKHKYYVESGEIKRIVVAFDEISAANLAFFDEVNEVIVNNPDKSCPPPYRGTKQIYVSECGFYSDMVKMEIEDINDKVKIIAAAPILLFLISFVKGKLLKRNIQP